MVHNQELLILPTSLGHKQGKLDLKSAVYNQERVMMAHVRYFNHQIKSITSLNCNMALIQFVFSRGDTALW